MDLLLSAYPPATWPILVAAGALIGGLAGLLGIGGGVVAVPVLIEVFAALGRRSTARWRWRWEPRRPTSWWPR